MKRACLDQNANRYEQNYASSIRPLHISSVRMKRLILTLVAASLTTILMASDIITLNNQMMFEGEVLRIDECDVVFRAARKRHYIPATDIYSIEFADPSSKVYTGYLEMLETSPNLCLQARFDAENYHGKEVGHYFLGFLFGPFAMLGTALSNPKPHRGKDTYMMSQNKEHFSDPTYLECYKRRAKTRAIGMQGWGWATWIFLLLIL